MRLIDADALPEIKIHVESGYYTHETVAERIKGALIIARNSVKRAPTIDAVPVIRCKDCKHRGGYNCPMYHTETSLDDLDGFDDYNVDRTDNNGFCHRGEKKG